jgi:hypothetical protein
MIDYDALDPLAKVTRSAMYEWRSQPGALLVVCITQSQTRSGH